MTDAPTLRIRPAAADDIPEIARLWDDAFPGKRTVADRIRMLETGGRYGGLESVMVATTSDRGIVGATKIYRMTEYLAGTPMPMMGLAAVAVTPTMRRRGIGARLCTEAIAAAADRGDALSVLYPFRPDYYERLGWGLVGALHEYRFHTRALETGADDGHVRAAALERDAEAVAACYGRIAAASNGPIRRDRRVWAYHLTGQELGVRPVDVGAVWAGETESPVRTVVYDDGDIRGYGLLRYVTRGDPEGNTLQVRELLAESDEAYRGLLGHIAAQHDRWPRCHYFARPHERLGDLLTDPRPPGFRGARSLYFPTARIVRGPMLRLVDVRHALRKRRFFDAGGGTATTLAVEVSDPQRPANNGPWTVRVEADGGTEVEPGEAPSPDAALRTDAPTLARIFAGEVSATTAAVQGRAQVEGDTTLLDRAFSTRQRFWLLDEF